MANSFDISNLCSSKFADLIEEFKENPVGHHSPQLQRLLNVLRGAPMGKKHCLIISESNKEWILAKTSGRPGEPVKPTNQRFQNLAEAEWYVFRERWKGLTGEKLAK